MNSFSGTKFTGERALFKSSDLKINDSIFENGESPLKECRDIELDSCIFGWKYPLWYCKNIIINNCTWLDMARAGVWYTENIVIGNSLIAAPKNFRRCDGLKLKNVVFTNAGETLWNCRNVTMDNVTAKGDYFAMNSSGMEIEGLMLDGNYSFDGGRNITIRNSKLISKDAFWNSENITVYDSFISGEYLGWNSKKLTLINCTVESLQGLCYINNLEMKNCRMINTTLAFEYTTVNAQIDGRIESILNPGEGIIRADEIGELIMEREETDAGKINIICSSIDKKSEHPEWRVSNGL